VIVIHEMRRAIAEIRAPREKLGERHATRSIAAKDLRPPTTERGLHPV